MKPLTFAKLLEEARWFKKHGFTRIERHIALFFLIWGAKYYYVEQG